MAECPSVNSPLINPDGQTAPRLVDDKNVDVRILTRRDMMTSSPGLVKMSAVAFFLGAMLVLEAEEEECETKARLHETARMSAALRVAWRVVAESATPNMQAP